MELLRYHLSHNRNKYTQLSSWMSRCLRVFEGIGERVSKAPVWPILSLFALTTQPAGLNALKMGKNLK